MQFLCLHGLEMARFKRATTKPGLPHFCCQTVVWKCTSWNNLTVSCLAMLSCLFEHDQWAGVTTNASAPTTVDLIWLGLFNNDHYKVSYKYSHFSELQRLINKSTDFACEKQQHAKTCPWDIWPNQTYKSYIGCKAFSLSCVHGREDERGFTSSSQSSVLSWSSWHDSTVFQI